MQVSALSSSRKRGEGKFFKFRPMTRECDSCPAPPVEERKSIATASKPISRLRILGGEDTEHFGLEREWSRPPPPSPLLHRRRRRSSRRRAGHYSAGPSHAIQ